jgi:hypothetical protein
MILVQIYFDFCYRNGVRWRRYSHVRTAIRTWSRLSLHELMSSGGFVANPAPSEAIRRIYAVLRRLGDGRRKRRRPFDAAAVHASEYIPHSLHQTIRHMHCHGNHDTLYGVVYIQLTADVMDEQTNSRFLCSSA